jgi:NAD(P)-dependent dehydrogenase (short-subunit alcohol dehydrogenase family)
MANDKIPRAALITGAGRRIGAAIALALSQAG